jgi:plastocyanin
MNHPTPRLALLSALILVATGAAQAGSLQVRVTSQDGTPARDVVVWVATPVRVPLPAFAPATVVIEQRDLQFVPPVTVVRTGTPVRFQNLDRYDHHVRSVPSGPLGAVPPVKTFELRLSGEDPKNRSAEIVADKAGVVEQPAQKLSVGPAPQVATAQLNFAPRRRR